MAYPRNLQDVEPAETREWLDSLEYVLENGGIERANFLLERLSARMTRTGGPMKAAPRRSKPARPSSYSWTSRGSPTRLSTNSKNVVFP